MWNEELCFALNDDKLTLTSKTATIAELIAISAEQLGLQGLSKLQQLLHDIPTILQSLTHQILIVNQDHFSQAIKYIIHRHDEHAPQALELILNYLNNLPAEDSRIHKAIKQLVWIIEEVITPTKLDTFSEKINDLDEIYRIGMQKNDLEAIRNANFKLKVAINEEELNPHASFFFKRFLDFFNPIFITSARHSNSEEISCFLSLFEKIITLLQEKTPLSEQISLHFFLNYIRTLPYQYYNNIIERDAIHSLITKTASNLSEPSQADLKIESIAQLQCLLEFIGTNLTHPLEKAWVKRNSNGEILIKIIETFLCSTDINSLNSLNFFLNITVNFSFHTIEKVLISFFGALKEKKSEIYLQEKIEIVFNFIHCCSIENQRKIIKNSKILKFIILTVHSEDNLLAKKNAGINFIYLKIFLEFISNSSPEIQVYLSQEEKFINLMAIIKINSFTSSDYFLESHEIFEKFLFFIENLPPQHSLTWKKTFFPILMLTVLNIDIYTKFFPDIHLNFSEIEEKVFNSIMKINWTSVFENNIFRNFFIKATLDEKYSELQKGINFWNKKYPHTILFLKKIKWKRFFRPLLSHPEKLQPAIIHLISLLKKENIFLPEIQTLYSFKPKNQQVFIEKWIADLPHPDKTIEFILSTYSKETLSLYLEKEWFQDFLGKNKTSLKNWVEKFQTPNQFLGLNKAQLYFIHLCLNKFGVTFEEIFSTYLDTNQKKLTFALDITIEELKKYNLSDNISTIIRYVPGLKFLQKNSSVDFLLPALSATIKLYYTNAVFLSLGKYQFNRLNDVINFIKNLSEKEKAILIGTEEFLTILMETIENPINFAEEQVFQRFSKLIEDFPESLLSSIAFVSSLHKNQNNSQKAEEILKYLYEVSFQFNQPIQALRNILSIFLLEEIEDNYLLNQYIDYWEKKYYPIFSSLCFVPNTKEMSDTYEIFISFWPDQKRCKKFFFDIFIKRSIEQLSKYYQEISFPINSLLSFGLKKLQTSPAGCFNTEQINYLCFCLVELDISSATLENILQYNCATYLAVAKEIFTSELIENRKDKVLNYALIFLEILPSLHEKKEFISDLLKKSEMNSFFINDEYKLSCLFKVLPFSYWYDFLKENSWAKKLIKNSLCLATLIQCKSSPIDNDEIRYFLYKYAQEWGFSHIFPLIESNRILDFIIAFIQENDLTSNTLDEIYNYFMEANISFSPIISELFHILYSKVNSKNMLAALDFFWLESFLNENKRPALKKFFSTNSCLLQYQFIITTLLQNRELTTPLRTFINFDELIPHTENLVRSKISLRNYFLNTLKTDESFERLHLIFSMLVAIRKVVSLEHAFSADKICKLKLNIIYALRIEQTRSTWITFPRRRDIIFSWLENSNFSLKNNKKEIYAQYGTCSTSTLKEIMSNSSSPTYFSAYRPLTIGTTTVQLNDHGEDSASPSTTKRK